MGSQERGNAHVFEALITITITITIKWRASSPYSSFEIFNLQYSSTKLLRSMTKLLRLNQENETAGSLYVLRPCANCIDPL